MKQNSSAYIFRRSIYLFFSIFMLTGAVISGLMMIFYRSEIKTRLSQLKTYEEFSVNLQSKAIENLFDSIAGDLFFLSRQNELQEYLLKGDPSYLDEIASEYINLCAQKKIYDQIRFLDTNGMEMVRINYNQGKPARIASDKLQSKQKRYYFKDCYQLDQGEVFISPFDLNIEHDRIEQPLKPMIRLGTPVFDSNGLKRGIVLLNYLGSDLLNRLIESEQVSTGRTMLLNADGYWLLSPDSSQEWGFMFEGENRSFSYLYPDIWGQIKNRKNGQILTSVGLFTYRIIYPLKEGHSSSSGNKDAFGASQAKVNCREYHWYLVSFTPKEILDNFAVDLMMKLFGFGAGIFLIIASGSWFLAFAITRRRISQDQMKTMALYDALTDLPNRRLFYDRLSTVIKQSRRYKAQFGILYIDLDGFKKINDSLGHEAGDALLCKVADRLRQCVRESDTVARLGGDEFAVIVDRLNTDDGAQLAAGKIINILSKPITLPQGDARIGASVGISLFPINSEDGEELLRQADRAMYHSKRSGKNMFSLFSTELPIEHE
ncbi:MAG: sensor domain-containing diguanylate cyclase [Proteobacteria bacterium]|nr:sensor domain-containing diguanylate cyclase [Pseudomonadota bacterium]